MSMTLDDVTLEIMQSNEHLEKVVDLKTDENSLLESMAAALDIVVESFNEMLDKSEGMAAAPMLESTSDITEAPLMAAPLASGPTEVEKEDADSEEEGREDDKREEKQNNLLQKIADYSSNFVKGLEGLEGKAADTMGILGALGAAALLFFDPQTLMDIIIRVTDFIASIVEEVESVINMWDSDDITGSLMNIFDGFSNLFEDFGLEMGLLIGFIVLRFNLISKTFRLIGSAITTAGKIFSGIANTLKAIPSVAKGLLGVVGKLALPITIITGVISGIVNSFNKFREGDILGGLYAFVEGAFDSIVSAPLNLFKDLTAWILGKFGFDESADYLNSFDFSFEGIVNIVSDAFNSLMEFIYGLIPGAEDVVNMVKDGIGGVINFFTGGDSKTEEGSGVTAFTTDNELREMAKERAANSMFTSEDEAFNELVAERFEAEDRYVNGQESTERSGKRYKTKKLAQIEAERETGFRRNIVENDDGTFSVRTRERAQRDSRKRREGELGGIEESRINTSTPMERAIDPDGEAKRYESKKFAQKVAYHKTGSSQNVIENENGTFSVSPQPSPVRDAVVENQMLREEEQGTATAAAVDNSSRQSSSANVQSSTTNVYNTAYADDVNTSLAFSP